MNTNRLFADFKQLYKTQGLAECENRFIQDGVINHELFAQQTTKVLFIGKEHNDLDPTKSNEEYKPDYSIWWNGPVKYTFSHRISEWAYGIINDFPDYNQIDIEKKCQARKSIAFINVKKASGRATSNSDVITDYILESKELLQRQVREIAPTIIICCFRYDWYVKSLFDLQEVGTTSNGFIFSTWEGIPVINFYHPSARKNKRLLYEELKEAVNYATAVQSEYQMPK